jgi:pimeloyl-ACP methyl ester carboxylesterase
MISKQVRFLGKNITYYSSGKGEKCLLFLHGFLESSTMWNDYTHRLQNEYKIISMDIPGQGKSEVIADIHSPSLMADTVDTVLKTEGIKTITIIGHSMGGYVALAFAERYKEKIKNIVLMNSTALADSDLKKADRDRAIKVLEKNPAIFINEAIPNLFADDNRQKFAQIIEELKKEALLTPVNGAVACLRGMKIREDKTSLLIKGDFPVLIIAGEKDNIIPLEKVKEQIALNPKIESLIIPGCGHMAFIEAKEECFEAIEKFIESN